MQGEARVATYHHADAGGRKAEGRVQHVIGVVHGDLQDPEKLRTDHHRQEENEIKATERHDAPGLAIAAHP